MAFQAPSLRSLGKFCLFGHPGQDQCGIQDRSAFPWMSPTRVHSSGTPADSFDTFLAHFGSELMKRSDTVAKASLGVRGKPFTSFQATSVVGIEIRRAHP
jgi:hypothetical protein